MSKTKYANKPRHPKVIRSTAVTETQAVLGEDGDVDHLLVPQDISNADFKATADAWTEFERGRAIAEITSLNEMLEQLEEAEEAILNTAVNEFKEASSGISTQDHEG